ncbi:MAG: tRNA pseudouridine(55) synthase TruB, partial [Pacificimonas sp.]
MHGWIILDKPIGVTSAGGVARVKRLMRDDGIRKPKVGHGGTLDPLATGVLPIALGEATKLTGRMLNGDKSYDFTIGFGAETATDDLEGEVVAESDTRPTIDAIALILPRFTGLIRQRPPAYSALKVDGERAYKRARAGEVLEMPERAITVQNLAISSSSRMRGSSLTERFANPDPRIREDDELIDS